MTPRLPLWTCGALVAALASGCGTDDGGAPPDLPADSAVSVDAAVDDGGRSADVTGSATDDGSAPIDAGTEDAGADTVARSLPWPKSAPYKPHRPVACPTVVGADDLYGQLLAKLQCVVKITNSKPTYDACTRQNVRIPKTLYDAIGGNIASDPQRLGHFHDVQEDLPGKGACFANNIAKGLDHAAESDHPLTVTIAESAAAIGVVIDVGGLFVLPSPDAPLVEALRALHIMAGAEFDENAAKQAAEQVPMPVRVFAAKVLLGALAAIPMRDNWLAEAGHPTRYNFWFASGTGNWIPQQGGGVDPDNTVDAKVFELKAGYNKLFGGAGRLMQAIDEAMTPADLAGLLKADGINQSFSFVAPTPYGKVVLRGGGDDTYEPTGELKGDLLLVIDTGGNDTYRIAAGANTSYKNPASVLIDLGGDDIYGYPEKQQPIAPGLLADDGGGRLKFQDWLLPASMSKLNRQGAGRLGYGVLIDVGGGKDRYSSPRMSQGWANFGVGVLWDDGGDDTYISEAASQGAAYVGIAVLHDGGGNDTYRSFWNAQGFAWISSFGALYDRSGDDSYECVVYEPLVYDSPQTPKTANASLCQGTAFGWRRDKTKTHRSGGIAILRDRTGADAYTGSTFTQGTGYWLGTGILADGAGDDTYDGLFYAQGAAAHYAIGMLLEGAGDDVFNAKLKPINCAIGCAHDFSSALFVDEQGNDDYRGKSRAIGASKCHGHGVFVDNGGDDTYASVTDKSIGWATDFDGKPGTCGNAKLLPSYGFFVDAGGKDSYAKPTLQGYGDGKTWITDDPDDPDALELSGGIDAQQGDSFTHVK